MEKSTKDEHIFNLVEVHKQVKLMLNMSKKIDDPNSDSAYLGI